MDAPVDTPWNFGEPARYHVHFRPWREDGVAKRILIEGLVQGVGYRYAFSDEAEALGLKGWVRNRANGAVEACVHGPDAAIEHIVAWAHKGPPAARVRNVVVSDADEALPERFEIRPTA